MELSGRPLTASGAAQDPDARMLAAAREDWLVRFNEMLYGRWLRASDVGFVRVDVFVEKRREIVVVGKEPVVEGLVPVAGRSRR